jgi:hypothetical protein
MVVWECRLKERSSMLEEELEAFLVGLPVRRRLTSS